MVAVGVPVPTKPVKLQDLVIHQGVSQMPEVSVDF
jgi:hypothetical protein